MTIRVFPDARTLNREVAKDLVAEFRRPGLIVLPSDSTHGDEPDRVPGEIYGLVNDRFARNQKPHDELTITHMDDLVILDGAKTAKGERIKTFGNSLRRWLPDVMRKIGDRFHPIISDSSADARTALAEYTKLLATGPRVIVGGIGAEPPPHVAYIGENLDSGNKPVLNLGPAQVKLRPEEAERRGVTEALTMGLDSFNPGQNENLETVILTAKGERKQDAVKYALREALLDEAPQGESACGQVIKRFANAKPEEGAPKLILNLDPEAASKVLKDKELMEKLRSLK